LHYPKPTLNPGVVASRVASTSGNLSILSNEYSGPYHWIAPPWKNSILLHHANSFLVQDSQSSRYGPDPTDASSGRQSRYPPSRTTYSSELNESVQHNQASAVQYAPSNYTPSHRSISTGEDYEVEGQGPQAPYPYSTLDLYNSEYGLEAMQRYDRSRRPN
jgi:hypothetical protein